MLYTKKFNNSHAQSAITPNKHKTWILPCTNNPVLDRDHSVCAGALYSLAVSAFDWRKHKIFIS